MKRSFLSIIVIAQLIFLSCAKPPEVVSGDVVINEMMSVNRTVATDQNGEYDDWIELYNLTSYEQDLTGYYISDNKYKPRKWKFPSGTTIPANGFIIVWADDDTGQLGLHLNFKLSSSGEEVFLTSSNGDLIDDVILPAQDLELSYSRNPDGYGTFRWQTPTFDKSNDTGK
jgi:hypothetical protein